MKSTKILILIYMISINGVVTSYDVTQAKEQQQIKPNSNMQGSKNIRIYYASSSWNKDSSQLDSAFLFFRDGRSGKTAKILIEETEPDSSTFQGNFSIGWAQMDTFEPEVYIPPENLRGDSQNSLAKFYQLLNTKKVTQKPVVFRVSPEGQTILDVYDTPEQAQQAQQAYQKEAELAQQAELAKKSLSQPVPHSAAVEVAKNKERQVVMDQMAKEAAKREGDRIRLEQIERQRMEERIKQQKMRDEKARMARQAQAREFAEAALDLYRLGQYKEAEENFRNSVELDPENKDYYFKYAITLYRNDKFNESLVIMKLVPEDPSLTDEKNYYMGLIHYRLKEFDSALTFFNKVQQSHNVQLAPSATFYKGLILFTQEKFEEAKPAFEWVIDASQDPTLDNRAEEYLEKIAQLIIYNKNKKKKFLVNATVGANYDTNVLLASDNVNSQGSATKEADYRLVLGGGGEYRWIYGDVHELSTKINSSYLRSSKSELSIADPFQNTLTLPYVYKGNLLGKGFRLNVSPGYETLNMPVETDGPQENILNSILLTIDNTFIMSDRWYSSYVIDVRQDDSRLTSSVGDNDADALKYSLKTTQMFFRDKSLKRAVIGNLGLVENDAKGSNKKYFRIEGGVTYTAPVRKDDSWNLGLAVYTLNYPSADDHRKDTDVSLTLGYAHPFYEWLLTNLSVNYTNNQSNVTDNQYSKYSFMATSTINWGW